MQRIIDLMDVSILKLEKLLVSDKKDPIDIIEIYTKKSENKDNRKQFKQVNNKDQTINSK